MHKTVLVALLLIGPLAAAADMYRTVQPDGTVAFSDRPLSADSVLIQEDATQSSQRRPARQSPAADSAAATADSAGTDSASSADAQMAANCKQARESLDSLATSNRLYVVQPDGERHFLSEDEVSQAREHAEAEVARWCDAS